MTPRATPRDPRFLLLAAFFLPALFAAGTAGAEIWRPAPGTSFQWQLDTPVDVGVAAEVFDIDLFDNDAAVVAELKARSKRVICYISVGSWEQWRPDAALFPSQVLGLPYDGWEGELWLDIRQLDALAPILRARLDQCRDKGFDAVEPDNIDGYQNATGFPLTRRDQLRFNRWLAREAHARGLSIGLKNAPELAWSLVRHFDWALTEDCFDQGWCEEMLPFVHAGKAVFATEYTDTGVDFDTACSSAAGLGITAVLKHRDLDAFLDRCPGAPTVPAPPPPGPERRRLP